MKTQECDYLLRILANSFRNAEGLEMDMDCYQELSQAVEGLDDLLSSMQDRLDQQKALIVNLERWADRQAGR